MRFFTIRQQSRPLLLRHVRGRVPVPHALGNVLGAGLPHSFLLRVRLRATACGGHFTLRNRSHVILLELPAVTVARYSARHSFRASGWACSGPSDHRANCDSSPSLRNVAVSIISIPSSRSVRATLWNTKTLTDGSKAAIGGTPSKPGKTTLLLRQIGATDVCVHTGRPILRHSMCVCGYPCRRRSGGPFPPHASSVEAEPR